MEAVELYPDVPDARPTADLPSQADLAARVAELERVVATIASLREERMRADRPDPVALTAALYPGGMRSARSARRRPATNGTIGLRFVMFDPSAPR